MKNNLYLRIWRWHFYAGLLVFPILIILSISGAVYLFQPQLDRLIYSKLVNVTAVSTGRVDESKLLLKVKSQYPSATIARYFSPENINQSARFDLITKAGVVSTFYNPYDGSFLGERNNENYIMEFAKKVHGELLIGTTGDTIVELSACWALILIFTGLYLAWPRTNEKIWGVFLPRISKGGRTLWRDLHTVSGIYASIFIIFLILTGLPWTGFWGSKVLHVWDKYPNQMFSNYPQSKVLTQSLNENRAKIVPWAVEKIPMPESIGSGKSLTLTEVISIGLKEKIIPPYNVSFPSGPYGVYTVSAVTGDPAHERVVHIDQYSGKVLTNVGFADYSAVATTVQYGIALHEGKYFGLSNQLLGLFACLMLILISISGFVMWWKRRIPGTLSAPTLHREELSSKQMQMIGFLILLMGVIFPLMGASMIVVWILDKLIFSKISI